MAFLLIALHASFIYINLVVTGKRYSSPSNVFNCFWFLMTLLPILIVQDVDVEIDGHLFIVTACIAFSFSSFIYLEPFKTPLSKSKGSIDRARLTPKSSLVGFIGLTIVFLLMLDLILNGFSILEFIINPMKAAGRYASLRYNEDLTKNISTRLIYPLIYLNATLVGFKFATQGWNTKTFSFMILPAVIPVLTQSSKGGVLLALALFIGSYFAIRYSLKAELTLATSSQRLVKTKFHRVVWFAPILALAFLYSFYSRGLSDSNSAYMFWKLQSYVASYSSGHYYAFSDWMSWYMGGPHLNKYESMPPTLGLLNFMFIFTLFGDFHVEKGVFTETLQSGTYLKTNIYTQFRGLITDFGILGSYIYLFIFGLIFNLSHLRLGRKATALNIVGSVAFFGFCYQSYIISFFNYLSVFGYLVLLFVYLSIKGNKKTSI